MDLESVGKKVREARYFVDKMKEQEGRAFGDKEPFDFNLSAFLSAARSVDYRLIHEHGATYKPWREKWNSTLTAPQIRLIEFLAFDRGQEVHATGSSRGVKDERINISGSYSDASGTLTVSGPPLVLGAGPQQAFITKPAYYFTIDGVEHKATETCDEYLVLLERMVATFKTDHP